MADVSGSLGMAEEPHIHYEWRPSLSHSHCKQGLDTLAIPCVASSTNTWVNQPLVGCRTTRMYPAEVQYLQEYPLNGLAKIGCINNTLVELVPVKGCELRSGYTLTTALQWLGWEKMILRQWILHHGREGLSDEWQIASVSHVLHFT